ncbi:MAG: SMC-Scp complex subunit ScpB, partial [Pararhizobium sp.]
MTAPTPAQRQVFEDDADETAEGGEAIDALADRVAREAERIAGALVFASADPVRAGALAEKLPDGLDVDAVMTRLSRLYAERGVNLVRVGNAWAFRTAADLSFLVHREQMEVRKLSRAALEVLAIIAYHQPVTRAEIEEIRGVATSKGTLDVLLETGWVRMRGRRKAPGRPVTYGTTLD